MSLYSTFNSLWNHPAQDAPRMASDYAYDVSRRDSNAVMNPNSAQSFFLGNAIPGSDAQMKYAPQNSLMSVVDGILDQMRAATKSTQGGAPSTGGLAGLMRGYSDDASARKDARDAAAVDPFAGLQAQIDSAYGVGADRDTMVSEASSAAALPYTQEIRGARKDRKNDVRDVDRFAAGLMAPLEQSRRDAKVDERRFNRQDNREARSQNRVTRGDDAAALAELGGGFVGDGGTQVAARQRGGAADAVVASQLGSARSDTKQASRGQQRHARELQDWARGDATETKSRVMEAYSSAIDDLRGQRASASAQAGAQAGASYDGLAASNASSQASAQIALEQLKLKLASELGEASGSEGFDLTKDLSTLAQATRKVPVSKDEETGKIIYKEEPLYSAESLYQLTVQKEGREEADRQFPGMARQIQNGASITPDIAGLGEIWPRFKRQFLGG